MCQDRQLHAFSEAAFQRGVALQRLAVSHYVVDRPDPRPCCPWHIPGMCWYEECCDDCPEYPPRRR